MVLRFFGELTQSQIAEWVGLSLMHVSRLLAATLTSLGSANGYSPTRDQDPTRRIGARVPVGQVWSVSAITASMAAVSSGRRQNMPKWPIGVSISRYRPFGIFSQSALQSSGGKNRSSENGATNTSR